MINIQFNFNFNNDIFFKNNELWIIKYIDTKKIVTNLFNTIAKIESFYDANNGKGNKKLIKNITTTQLNRIFQISSILKNNIIFKKPIIIIIDKNQYSLYWKYKNDDTIIILLGFNYEKQYKIRFYYATKQKTIQIKWKYYDEKKTSNFIEYKNNVSNEIEMIYQIMNNILEFYKKSNQIIKNHKNINFFDKFALSHLTQNRILLISARSLLNLKII